jgi:hypothetical protein
MTNTLHRQGTPEDLKHDYIIFVHTAKGINREGSAEKIREFMKICLKYHPVNMGDVKLGSMHQDDIVIERLIADQSDGTVGAATFTDLDTLQQVVEELIRADLNICINITGLLDRCRSAAGRPGSPATAPSTRSGSGGQGIACPSGRYWSSTPCAATGWSPST